MLLPRLALIVLLLAALPAAAAPPLTVFAASSLQDALDAVVAAWHRHGGARVRVAYAGSPALARQIEQGAPADLFLSADRDWMDYLQAAGRIDPGSRHELLGNRLVLIAPRSSALAPIVLDLNTPLPRPLPLAPDQRFALALTASVPAGRYAKAALTRLGYWTALAPQVVEAENVRAALQLVARGEAAMGVVYRSDALAEPRVRVLAEIPFGSHPRIAYPLARVAASRHPDAAALIAFLRDDEAAALFRRHGFSVLD